MSDLMQKLAMSKKIMEKHNEVPRGQTSGLAMVNQNVLTPLTTYRAMSCRNRHNLNRNNRQFRDTISTTNRNK